MKRLNLLSSYDQTDAFRWSDPLVIGRDEFKRRQNKHRQIARAEVERLDHASQDVTQHGEVHVICKNGKYV